MTDEPKTPHCFSGRRKGKACKDKSVARRKKSKNAALDIAAEQRARLALLVGATDPDDEPVLKLFHRISHPKERAFFAFYSRYPNISRAAKVVGISRELHHWWTRSDADYMEAFAIARDLGRGALEDTATEMAIVDKNPTMVIFMLKAADPERYRERTSGEVEWDGDLSKIKPHQIPIILKQLRADLGIPEPAAELPEALRVEETTH